jgi:UDP-glucose 4-epimerase
MRVLVTGGAGFVGSSLVREWLRRGAEVVVLDNLVATCSLRSLEDVVSDVRFVHGDVRAPEDFARLPKGPYDRVYHLAASFANELSMDFPVVDVRTNAEGTLNVVNFAKETGCNLFVYTASSSSYGDVPVPMAEDGPMHPHTPYALSKHMGELHVRASGLPFAVFRLFNVYGPGEPPGRYRNVMPNMFHALDATRGTIRIFGDGATRDFTYIDDAVRFLSEAERAQGQVVNLGSGVETPIPIVARTILRLRGRAPEETRVEPRRPWDRVVARCADVTRLRSVYGAVPSTPLDLGLERTHAWLVAHRYIRGAVA